MSDPNVQNKRRCVFTGKYAGTNLNVGHDSHNWARTVPCDHEYKDLRRGEVLSEDEMDAIAMFYLIEAAQLRMDNLKLELQKIQKKIRNKIPKLEKEKNKKTTEIEQAYVMNEINDMSKTAIEQVLEKKLKIWE